MTVRLRVISLGAGVQSTTLALMAAHGEITPMPDCAIFADTQAEPAEVYDHLRWLMSPGVLPFPVEVVTAGDLYARVVAAARREAANPVPFYTEARGGGRGMLSRNCTRDYKVVPIARAIRARLDGRATPGSVEKWIGISTDEAHRMKPAREPWATHRWPLIERRMSRWDCLQWLRRHGYPEPPKSACWFCPYAGDARWRDMRDRRPAEWASAVALDASIRDGFVGSTQRVYMHDSLRALPEVDLSTPADRGQGDLFGNECEGLCGV